MKTRVPCILSVEVRNVYFFQFNFRHNESSAEALKSHLTRKGKFVGRQQYDFNNNDIPQVAIFQRNVSLRRFYISGTLRKALWQLQAIIVIAVPGSRNYIHCNIFYV